MWENIGGFLGGLFGGGNKPQLEKKYGTWEYFASRYGEAIGSDMFHDYTYYGNPFKRWDQSGNKIQSVTNTISETVQSSFGVSLPMLFGIGAVGYYLMKNKTRKLF